MSVIEFPGPELAIERYDDEGPLRHAEHFRYSHSCGLLSLATLELLADEGVFWHFRSRQCRN
jgi:hypothetical protein